MSTVATQQLPQGIPLDVVNDHSAFSRPKGSLLAALPALKQQLSEKAIVYLPQDEGFGSAVQRFSDYKRPLPGAAVCTATEADIISTVSLL